MSLATETILDSIAPQFVGRADKAVFISMATEQSNSSYFGTMYSYAVAYLAAHLMTLSSTARNGSAGAESSKSEGQLSVSYATISSDNSLNSTWYGQEYMRLRRSRSSAIGITGGRDVGY